MILRFNGQKTDRQTERNTNKNNCTEIETTGKISTHELVKGGMPLTGIVYKLSSEKSKSLDLELENQNRGENLDSVGQKEAKNCPLLSSTNSSISMNFNYQNASVKLIGKSDQNGQTNFEVAGVGKRVIRLPNLKTVQDSEKTEIGSRSFRRTREEKASECKKTIKDFFVREDLGDTNLGKRKNSFEEQVLVEQKKIEVGRQTMKWGDCTAVQYELLWIGFAQSPNDF